MPRGFLVKRFKQSTVVSYRERRTIEDDRSDSGSEYDTPYPNFGSPDSGYSASPNTHVSMDKDHHVMDKDNNNITRNLPANVNVNKIQNHSPVYYTSFDRLNLSADSPTAPTNEQRGDGLISPIITNTVRKRSSEIKKKTALYKKTKAIRKINFDLDTTSPVSGTIIKDISDGEEGRVVCGDIEPSFNLVEITPEARAEIERINNRIGDYVCQLCKEFFDDAFQLAQHRCSCILHVEYRCPECEKVFNCPANLASHRRWHKPKQNGTKMTAVSQVLPATESHTLPYLDDNHDSLNANNVDLRVTQSEEDYFECDTCRKKFRREAFLKKHMLTHLNNLSLPCRICGKVFSNDGLRIKHEAQHGIHDSQLTCELCNLTFTNKAMLDKHSRMHNKNNFHCRYCSSSFHSSPGLTRHINKCHPSENRQVILLQIPASKPEYDLNE